MGLVANLEEVVMVEFSREMSSEEQTCFRCARVLLFPLSNAVNLGMSSHRFRLRGARGARAGRGAVVPEVQTVVTILI